jgi:hypothetical protein
MRANSINMTPIFGQVLAAGIPSVKQDQNSRFELCLCLSRVRSRAMNLARIVFRHCVYEFLWAERISRHFVLAKLSFWSTVGTGMLAKRRLAYFWAYV